MFHLTARELHRKFITGELLAAKIVENTLSRIEKHEPQIDAFLSVLKERAMKKAHELDQKKASGQPLGKLAGIPIAIKDNIHIHGVVTTCGSKFLSNYRAVFDASVVELMEKEDALLIGKTNLDEFAMGSSTENSAYKLTKNPWDFKAVPGGSSGGSAAAVAARFCPLSLGSDTGGSVRQPAAFCGIAGFKPSYGRVSRYGLVAFGSSLDQIGSFATNTADLALLMEILGKHCPRDSTSINMAEELYLKQIEAPIEKKIIGIPWNFLKELNTECRENFEKSMDLFKQAGFELVEVDLDILKASIAVYYIIATAEASTNLARFDGIRYGIRSTKAKTLEEVYDFSKQEGFGPEVKMRILLGTYVLSSGYQDAFYKKAQKVRRLMINSFKEAFKMCNMIAMPTSPFTAFTSGTIQDPLQMYLQDVYTIPANLAGLPAISVPSGFSKEKKPYGLQLIGPHMADARVLQYAHAFEQMTGYGKEIPPFFRQEISS